MRRKTLLFFIIILGCGIIGLSLLAIRPYLVRSADKLKLTYQSRKLVGQKVLILGINGLDWKLIQRFAASGDLTVIPELISTGSCGQISTFFHDDEDAIWTTVSTGYLPETHGISNKPGSSNRDTEQAGNISTWKKGWLRKRWAFWEITSHSDKQVTVIGWPVSWPADTVKGILVSDRLFLLNPDRSFVDARGLCHPPHLLEKLKPVIESCRNEYVDLFNSYFKTDADELDRFLALTWKNSVQPVPHQNLSRSSPMESLKQSFHKDHLNYEIFLWNVAEYGQKPLMACYFESLDRVSHMFSISASRNSRFRKNGPKKNARKAAFEFLKKYYQYIDRSLGSIIKEMDPETTILIVSGHGFNLKEGGHKDCPPGWFLLHGSAIRTKKNIYGVAISDIAPTLLYLLELSIPDDMDGEIINEAFTLSHLEKHRIKYWSKSSPPVLPKIRNMESQHTLSQP